MSLQLNAAKAKSADKMSSVIRETGLYFGTITRAEKLLSKNQVKGVGFSFKTDDGMTANYLDVYTEKANGEELWGASIVQAVLCCTKTKTADEGQITFEKWDRDVGEMVKATATGYPALMGKRIGFILQRELGTNPNNGADTDKVVLVRVCEDKTRLTSSEILEGKTKAEKVDQFLKTLPPVRDNRKKVALAPVPSPAAASGDFDDDIPF